MEQQRAKKKRINQEKEITFIGTVFSAENLPHFPKGMKEMFYGYFHSALEMAMIWSNCSGFRAQLMMLGVSVFGWRKINGLFGNLILSTELNRSIVLLTSGMVRRMF